MNMKKVIIISSAAAFIILAVMFAISLNIRSLNRQIAQSNNMLLRTREELLTIEDQKEKAVKENEKLLSDTVSYVSLNTKLQTEKEALQKAVEEAQKLSENKEKDLKVVKGRLDEIEKGLADKKSKVHDSLIREKKAITKKMASLKSSLKNERSIYHYNLGVAYAAAKLYDEALVEYKKSLETDPDNADTHYNLAVLYDTVQSEPENAVIHYKRYIELKPDAEDREEIEAILNRNK